MADLPTSFNVSTAGRRLRIPAGTLHVAEQVQLLVRRMAALDRGCGFLDGRQEVGRLVREGGCPG